ncbi:MAG TPA: chaperone modulator CbpM [Burkholderiaceae bacterium]|jgi:chaperone modulatory protein CbpM|nr:chaperone modulator CbpM [Burkholderiaceae bacterium]
MQSSQIIVDGVVVEESVTFTLDELCRACRGTDMELLALVDEGVLDPAGSGPADWVFDGSALGRARTALRLIDDLSLSAPAVALVLDLMSEIEHLRARLRV